MYIPFARLHTMKFQPECLSHNILGDMMKSTPWTNVILLGSNRFRALFEEKNDDEKSHGFQ